MNAQSRTRGLTEARGRHRDRPRRPPVPPFPSLLRIWLYDPVRPIHRFDSGRRLGGRPTVVGPAATPASAARFSPVRADRHVAPRRAAPAPASPSPPTARPVPSNDHTADRHHDVPRHARDREADDEPDEEDRAAPAGYAPGLSEHATPMMRCARAACPSHTRSATTRIPRAQSVPMIGRAPAVRAGNVPPHQRVILLATTS